MRGGSLSGSWSASVARDVGLSRLERPPGMMDVTAPESASAIGGVEAVPLGQPVLERINRRMRDRTARAVVPGEGGAWRPTVRVLVYRTTSPSRSDLIAAS